MATKKKTVKEKKDEVRGLLKKLEDGVKGIGSSDEWIRWLEFQARLHNYSFSNCMLIALQCDNASLVMGFKAWKAYGRSVKKGEKALRILAPCFKKVKENGKEISKLVYFRSVPVFDVSQTEGDEIPSPCKELEGDDNALFNRLLDYSESRGVEVSVEPIPSRLGGANGYYDLTSRSIAIEKTLSPAQKAKTLAHEIAHSIMHADLSRDEQSREDRELEAESVAFIVCHHFGLDASSYSFGYVASWKGEGAEKGIKESAKRIADTASKIIEALEEN